eukprot:scpid82023/ scgid6598/ Bursicon; Bursicon subunit alpha; Single-chain bursicon
MIRPYSTSTRTSVWALLLIASILICFDGTTANSKCAVSDYNLPVSHKGCISRRIPTKTCSGLCRSHSGPRLNGQGGMESHCTCCQPSHDGAVAVTVNLTCPDLEEGIKFFRIPKATECVCTPCSGRHG